MKTKQIKCYTKRDLGKHTIYYCWRCFFRIITWKHLTRTIKINQNLWPCNSIRKNMSREVQSDRRIHRVFICRLNQPQIKNHRWFNLRMRNHRHGGPNQGTWALADFGTQGGSWNQTPAETKGQLYLKGKISLCFQGHELFHYA